VTYSDSPQFLMEPSPFTRRRKSKPTVVPSADDRAHKLCPAERKACLLLASLNTHAVDPLLAYARRSGADMLVHVAVAESPPTSSSPQSIISTFHFDNNLVIPRLARPEVLHQSIQVHDHCGLLPRTIAITAFRCLLTTSIHNLVLETPPPMQFREKLVL
jgi:hypothetical protein